MEKIVESIYQEAIKVGLENILTRATISNVVTDTSKKGQEVKNLKETEQNLKKERSLITERITQVINDVNNSNKEIAIRRELADLQINYKDTELLIDVLKAIGVIVKTK